MKKNMSIFLFFLIMFVGRVYATEITKFNPHTQEQDLIDTAGDAYTVTINFTDSTGAGDGDTTAIPKTIFMNSPNSDFDYAIDYYPFAITVIQIGGITDQGTWSGGLNVYDSVGGNSYPIDTGNITFSTMITIDDSFTSASVPANKYVGPRTDSTSGSPARVPLFYRFTID